MPGPWNKQIEAAYFARIGDDGLRHAIGKPFSDQDSGRLLMEIGVVLTLLPDPPAHVLDWGCGTGWTTAFLARRGYHAIGLDLSPDAIAAAQEAYAWPNLEYRIHDFEDPLDETGFDACVFFDSLHHADDEVSALRSAWSALKPGGIVIACEPGLGHGRSPQSVAAVESYGVHERDMPPSLILEAGRQAGFNKATVFAHPHVLHRNLYRAPSRTGSRQRFLATRLGLGLRMFRAVFRTRDYWGVVVLEK